MVGWALGRDFSESAAPAVQGVQASPTPGQESPTEQVFGEVAGGFVVHEGRHRVADRYPAGFPNTPEGAVSAAVHEIRALATLDTEDLVEAGSVYYGYDVTPDVIEEKLFPDRALGIELSMPPGAVFAPEGFPAPGASYQVVPVGVHWEELEEGLVRVIVLSEDEISDGRGLEFSRTYVHGRHMRWEPEVRGGDWIVVEVGDPIYADDYGPDPAALTLDDDRWTPLIAGGTSY
ncbi:hypothetical protein SUDANB121_05905 (plasmid) [Nocardiopsis dassonvillei]